MKSGSVILNRQMTTQAGKLTAKAGTKLVSVFLGSVRDGDEPDPERRLHKLGFRQMAMYEMTILISIDHVDRDQEDFDWRLIFSCLGHVDAVEAALRFANKAIADEFNRSTPGTPAPYLRQITVGTIQVGPIAEDGTPHNGRGPSYFGWTHDRGVSLEDHIAAMRIQAEQNSP
jgi:hypothetical protein